MRSWVWGGWCRVGSRALHGSMSGRDTDISPPTSTAQYPRSLPLPSLPGPCPCPGLGRMPIKGPTCRPPTQARVSSYLPPAQPATTAAAASALALGLARGHTAASPPASYSLSMPSIRNGSSIPASAPAPASASAPGQPLLQCSPVASPTGSTSLPARDNHGTTSFSGGGSLARQMYVAHDWVLANQ